MIINDKYIDSIFQGVENLVSAYGEKKDLMCYLELCEKLQKKPIDFDIVLIDDIVFLESEHVEIDEYIMSQIASEIKDVSQTAIETYYKDNAKTIDIKELLKIDHWEWSE